MRDLARRPGRILLRTWPLLAAVAVLIGVPFAMTLTHKGRTAVEAAIYLPDMVLQVPLPVRPVNWISDPPSVERVTIDYVSRNGPRSIEADLYIPASEGPHSGVVFSMGAPPLDLDDDRLVRIAEDSARSGVVMLVPFSERLDDWRIEPEEIDALVAEFEYVQQVPGVDPDRVGYFGASVGGSLALVAAADPRIAADVDHVVSFGGYYDALTAFGAIATRHIEYNGIDEDWSPDDHAEKVMAFQLIYRLTSSRDRALLEERFLDGEPGRDEELASLSPIGRTSYEFLANEDPSIVQDLIASLPESAVEELAYLSPANSIGDVQAELFILHDRGDFYIPYTETRRMEDDLRGRPDTHIDELRLFQHVEPKLNQRPEIIALDSARVLFRLYQLLLRWG